MFAYTTICRGQDDVYRVRGRFEDRTVISYHATQRAALARRDELFDRGCHSVHVSNMNTIGCAAGFPEHQGQLPTIQD